MTMTDDIKQQNIETVTQETSILESQDFKKLVTQEVNAILTQESENLALRVKELEERIEVLEENMPEDRVTIVVFSGDLDKVMASFIIATGALAMGYEVSLFFTFWGLNAVRKTRTMEGKNIMERMMSLMTPSSSQGMGISQNNFFGAGAKAMRVMMQQKNVENIEDLIDLTKEMGARFVSCGMSQMVMGINTEELRDDMEDGGVAAYLGDAVSSKVTLFI